ncbi:MAG: formate dehydrogenase accessory sulfurtransferase FdhD [Gluconacetobacter diazotrophicus]|nr:formate dehydrogenase accessory sulfurtransferase FdhD [Gluconacetobacter diazotrophicus]
MTVPERRWREAGATDLDREVPAELPVALSFNRTTHAVMMATPADLADFALGFALSEEILSAPSELRELDVVPLRTAPDAAPRGMECRMWISSDRMEGLDARRRHVAGPTGCGLCGLESLEAALRPVRRVPDGRRWDAERVREAMRSLSPAQALNRRTRAVHAAGFWCEEEGLVAVREDVGRHNALDKLHGALAGRRRTLADGILLLTSRVSVELVQKAALMGAPVLAAVSAPTALALDTARDANMTVVATAREDGFSVFTGRERIRT